MQTGHGVACAQERNDSLVNVAFTTVERRDLLGAISSVNIPDLMEKNYETSTLGQLEALVGGYTGNIWGQSPLVLVDGIPRDADTVNPSAVESVTVMKGASAVVLYGSRAAKGVILITTKRGVKSDKININVRANSGFYVPKSYPAYLNATQYMTLYNEACRNDGLSAQYTDEQIYYTSLGTNPYRYPDVDFYSSEYLRKAYNKSDVTAEIYGGNERARYYSNFNLSYNNSLLKYGESQKDNTVHFQVKSNIDVKLTNWLTAAVDAGAIFDNTYTGCANFWSEAATLRPNLFSPWIPIDMIDPNNSSLQTMVQNSSYLIDGRYLFGGLSTELTNTFADMNSNAYTKGRNRTFQFNVGLNADLSMALKGLSFKTVYSVDYTDYYEENYTTEYAVYEPVWAQPDGKDMIVGLTKYNLDTPSTNESVGGSSYSQMMSFKAQFDYDRIFAQHHNVHASLIGWGFQQQDAEDEESSYHRTSNVNLGIQASYNYRHKYYADFSSAVVHSAKLPAKNRTAFSPTVTLGWRISDEDFFKNKFSFVDDLKLTASYANLHQDLDISGYYLYEAYYNSRAFWYTYNDGNSTFLPASVRGGNPDLDFVERNEFRLGLETSLFNRMITVDANYFLQYTDGLLAQGENTVYPAYYSGMGSSSFLPYLNYNRNRRMGIDFTVNFHKKWGPVDVNLGLSGMYYTSKAMVRDEAYSEDYQYRAGRPIDVSYGYLCEGYYQSQEEIDARGVQHALGEVMPGDLRYTDVNGDNVIDSRDQVELGRTGSEASPFTFGLNLTLRWNGFTLFAYGTGQTGAIGYKNSSYYHINSSDKYSEVVVGRWTEDTKNTATYPRLTTLNNNHNFQNSTYWRYKTNRFDLNKVQLTYDLPDHLFQRNFIKRMSVYVSGESLLTISKERKHMEMNVGSAPQCRFYNVGIKAAF